MWGLTVDPICVLCGVKGKSRDCLFFDCDYFKQVWKDIMWKCNQQYMCSDWEEKIAT